ncbi:hypothetical protein LCGC14_2425220, partial [marine sediment metagenome]
RQVGIQAAPIALGAAFGGVSGATGAAEGVGDVMSEQAGERASQRNQLLEAIEAERQRKQQSTIEAQRAGGAQRRFETGLESVEWRARESLKAAGERHEETLAAQGQPRPRTPGIYEETFQREKGRPETLAELVARQKEEAEIGRAPVRPSQVQEKIGLYREDPEAFEAIFGDKSDAFDTTSLIRYRGQLVQEIVTLFPKDERRKTLASALRELDRQLKWRGLGGDVGESPYLPKQQE